MPPTLSVVALSDAFSETWTPLTASAGLAAAFHSLSDRIALQDPELATVISAGGVESDAAVVVEALYSVGVRPLVVGVERNEALSWTLRAAGAAGYYVLPGDLQALVGWLRSRADQSSLPVAEVCAAERQTRYDFPRMVGRSRELMRALARTECVIPDPDVTVLILGETGTGKDLLAGSIHENGLRANRPYVEINCAALPSTLLEAELFGYEKGAFTDARAPKPGLFETADGGTLFLDEIGDLSLELQAKLLRVLEGHRVRRLGSVKEREIDVRVLAATHVDLPAAVQCHRFRRDLFYRLDVATIELPPLRERGDDVILLAEHFLREASERRGHPTPPITPELESALRRHSWPGNVRELRNGIERAMLFGKGKPRVEDLVGRGPDTAFGGLEIPFPASMRNVEEAVARATVERLGGNKSDAARLLGISRKYLYRLLGEGKGE